MIFEHYAPTVKNPDNLGLSALVAQMKESYNRDMFSRFAIQLRDCQAQLQEHKEGLEKAATKVELQTTQEALETTINQKVQETNEKLQSEAIDRIA